MIQDITMLKQESDQACQIIWIIFLRRGGSTTSLDLC